MTAFPSTGLVQPSHTDAVPCRNALKPARKDGFFPSSPFVRLTTAHDPRLRHSYSTCRHGNDAAPTLQSDLSRSVFSPSFGPRGYGNTYAQANSECMHAVPELPETLVTQTTRCAWHGTRAGRQPVSGPLFSLNVPQSSYRFWNMTRCQVPLVIETALTRHQGPGRTAADIGSSFHRYQPRTRLKARAGLRLRCGSSVPLVTETTIARTVKRIRTERQTVSGPFLPSRPELPLVTETTARGVTTDSIRTAD